MTIFPAFAFLIAIWKRLLSPLGRGKGYNHGMANIDENYFNPDEGIKQNQVEDILEEGETILQRLKPDRTDYILEAIFKGLPIALLWAAFDTFAIIMMFSSGAFAEMGGWMALFIIGFFGLHLIPVWLYVGGIIKRVAGYKNIEYVITDKRIIIRSGLIGIDFRYFYYSAIQSVTVKVGLWDRLFKVGDLYLTATNQAAVLEDIKNPYFFGTKIEKIVQDIKADISYPNDLRPEENHGYNTKYKG